MKTSWVWQAKDKWLVRTDKGYTLLIVMELRKLVGSKIIRQEFPEGFQFKIHAYSLINPNEFVRIDNHDHKSPHYHLDQQEKDFDSIYRGAFYTGKQYGKPQQFIYFYSVYDSDGPRGALLGNAQEIVFDECLPTEISKYLVSDEMTEEEMFSQILGGSYRTDKENPVHLCYLGNPYDRFFYGFNNWQKELEEWAKKYQKEKPTEFTIKEVKEFEDGDELIYLRKFPERRKLISKFKTIDSCAWDNKFFVPKEDMNMIDKPIKFFPLRMWFNGIIYAGIPRQTKKFFYTPYTEEKITKNLPAWVFTSEEWYACSQRDKYLKKASEESWRLAKKLAQKEIAFADFESRSKVLEFISKHKHPHQHNREPFQKMKTY